MCRPRDPLHTPPARVIFVCMGNICRSPMAAALLRYHLAAAGVSEVEVTSAGTGSWHVGDPPDRRARDALTLRGLSADHRAQQFQPSWFDTHPLVVALDRDNQRDLRRMAPDRKRADEVRLLLEFDPSAELLDVPDPYYGSAADFETVLSLIEPACLGMVAHLQRPATVGTDGTQKVRSAHGAERTS